MSRPDRPASASRPAVRPRIDAAAQRSRASAHLRAERLRHAGRSVLQISLAAMLAWLVARHVLQSPRPFFAPVAAIITLGVTYGQRGRRAAELALGVAVGILIADLAVLLVGTGTLQLGAVVLLSVSAAHLLGSSPLIVNQAGISAVLVVAIAPPAHGFAFTRFFDALAGGATALLVGALVLPADPLALLRRAAVPVLEELAATLEDVAAAVRERDRDAADRALDRSRGIDAMGFRDAVVAGRETARTAPPRRRTRGHVGRYADAAAQVELAIRNVRVLARGVIRAIELGDAVPPGVADALGELATAVRGLEAMLQGAEGDDARVRGPALRAAAAASLVLEGTANLSVSVLVGQVRSTAVDLLRAAGMGRAAAIDAVRDAARQA